MNKLFLLQKIKLDRRFIPFLLLLIFCFFVYLPGIAELPVIDRDEAHFAQATKQMLQSGNFFQIRFQDQTRFRKPPGINWLQALSVKLWSSADSIAIWPYRLPSTFGATCSVLLIYFFASRFSSRKTAFLAAMMLASSLLLVTEAHMAVIDASLLLTVVIMQGALWLIWNDKQRSGVQYFLWLIFFWLALSAGLVLKGVTALVAILSIITLSIWEKNWRWLKDLHVFYGLIFVAGITFCWLYFVNQAEHSNYLWQMLHRDLLPKLQGGHESHGKPPLFHLLILPVTFWPSSLFLLPTFIFAFKNRKQPQVKFLLSWAIPTWLFFECMPTKLPQYILPIFPPLAILTAMGLEHFFAQYNNKLLTYLQTIWLVFSCTIGLALFYLAAYFNSAQLFLNITPAFFILMAAIIAYKQVRLGFFDRAVIYSSLFGGVAYAILFQFILPHFNDIWLSKNIAQSLAPYQITKDNAILVSGFDEPSLVFLLNADAVHFTQTVHSDSLKSHQLAIIDANDLSKIISEKDFEILARVNGFNYSKGRWRELVILQKNERRNADL